MNEMSDEPYIVNLDPAVQDTLYEPNLDIRDTVDYRKVMNTHKLGPNGAILTSLNLFSTSIDKIIELLASKTDVKSNFKKTHYN